VKADWEHGVSSLGQDQNYGAKFKKDWSALADDFRTFLLAYQGSESIFQQLTIQTPAGEFVNE
jgi:hypothetical protein